MARGLVRGEMLAQIIVQLFLFDLHLRRRPDERRDHFAPFRIRQAHNGDVADARMAKQQLLELARVDVLAAADDHVLQPALDRAVAAAIHRAEIAGMQPALGIDGGGGRRVVLEVAVHDMVAARADLADLADRDGLAGGRIDDTSTVGLRGPLGLALPGIVAVARGRRPRPVFALRASTRRPTRSRRSRRYGTAASW